MGPHIKIGENPHICTSILLSGVFNDSKLLWKNIINALL